MVNEPTAKVTLVQEVETLKLYLEIEKMRFEDRLRPHFKIDGDTIGARIPVPSSWTSSIRCGGGGE